MKAFSIRETMQVVIVFFIRRYSVEKLNLRDFSFIVTCPASRRGGVQIYLGIRVISLLGFSFFESVNYFTLLVNLAILDNTVSS
jgi:hypothetical protein